MYHFSKQSLDKLRTCDERLQEILHEAIKYIDFSVLCGHRSKEEQNKVYDQGKSRVRWPDSKHNTLPSLAVDVWPYPIDWNDTDRAAYLAGMILQIAKNKGYDLRWGGDWDKDGRILDSRLIDMPHFELTSQ